MRQCKSLALCLLTAWFALVAGPSWGCGDKLVALGGGVRFEQVVVSRHPGRILMVVSPGSGLAEANSTFNLAASLRLVGHTVITADDTEAIDEGLLGNLVDLVLVDASEFSGAALHSSAVGQGPTILPVVFQDAARSHASAGWAPECIANAGERKGKALLKTVEATLARRSKGQPAGCSGSTTGRGT